MVKNNKGGSSHKKQGRKYTNEGGGSNNKTRFSEDPAELYAVCNKVYGSGHILVKCQDGEERLCVIRKKFKGRGKRDNNVSLGTWVLVGLREFEQRVVGKQEKCDLLEVYNESDKKVLENYETEIAWNVFRGISNHYVSEENDLDETFEFGDSKQIEYEELMENKIISNSDSDSDEDESDDKNLNTEKDLSKKNNDNSIIDVDDI